MRILDGILAVLTSSGYRKVPTFPPYKSSGIITAIHHSRAKKH